MTNEEYELIKTGLLFVATTIVLLFGWRQLRHLEGTSYWVPNMCFGVFLTGIYLYLTVAFGIHVAKVLQN